MREHLVYDDLDYTPEGDDCPWRLWALLLLTLAGLAVAVKLAARWIG